MTTPTSNYLSSSSESWDEVLDTQPFDQIIWSYVEMSLSSSLSDRQIEAMTRLLKQAEGDPTLSFWLDEIDVFLAQEMVTEAFVEQQKDRARVLKGFESWRIKEMNQEDMSSLSELPDTSVRVDLSESELSILDDMSQKKEMSHSGILRQALRLLGHIEERLSKGDDLFFEGPGKEKEKVFM